MFKSVIFFNVGVAQINNAFIDEVLAPELKQQFKLVYYVLMTLLKDQYPKKYLKMGDELEETTQEILEQTKEKAVRYA